MMIILFILLNENVSANLFRLKFLGITLILWIEDNEKGSNNFIKMFFYFFHLPSEFYIVFNKFN